MSALRNSQEYKSTCCYCGVGCGVHITKNRDGTIQVRGDAEHPSSRGMLCSKGMNLHHTVNDLSDRLLYPQLRNSKSQPLQRVSWEDALQYTARKFTQIIEQHGPDAVAFYASGQCLTEEYYVLNKLMKGFIGSNNIDSNSRLCMSSAVAAHKIAFGEDTVPVCYDDIELADCFLVTGANPAWCHPVLWRRVEAHKAANPAVRIIVVDPRTTDTCSIADLHLQINPGTDIVLNHAIGKLLIENGDIDIDFVRAHTDGFEEYRQLVAKRSLKESASLCGVSEDDIYLAAHYIGEASGFISMWTMGLNQSAAGVNKNLSLINLNLITGHIGKPGSGPFSLTGQPNAMGGREVGGLANLLPAHRNLNNAAHRKEIEEFWGGKAINPAPGLTATEMFDALEAGSLKAIWIIGTNPLVSLPNVRKAEAALEKADFVVVQEISNKPETLSYAHVVFPAVAWTEKEGTMTNSERRITYLPRINDAPGEALPDSEIICRLAIRMGFQGFSFNNASEIFSEHARLTASTSIDISTLNYEALKEARSIQWPYHADEKSAGTPRLFADGNFLTISKKAVISAVPDNFEASPPCPDYPLILTTGRIRDQWHTRTKTGKVHKLNQHIKQSYLEMSSSDACGLGLLEDDMVLVTSPSGEVRVKLKIAEGIKPGVVFMPMHWGRILQSDLNRVNNLTSGRLDPVSKEPDFKYTTVRVEKYKKPVQRIVIVGAGAGSFGFIKSYRELNQEDELVIFSKEDHPYYNRVMLPDYISGEQQWKQLVKMEDEEEILLNIRLLRGVSVENINPDRKTVLDSRGVETTYDTLILASGSRAAVPANVPDIPGIFTMRNRTDADSFKKYIRAQDHVVVVGGGLLGLEMAASLREIGVKVSIVQRSEGFLSRQLDAVGSRMLHDEMAELGCDIYYNEEVEAYLGKSAICGVKLKSGRTIDCDAAVIAIGTVPNMELARDCGLKCRRGVIVDQHLQTSDPNVYALGEVAEFKGTLYGITAAAEQQAQLLAHYLHGDIASFYEGSVFMNIIKIRGFDLSSIGLTECPDDRNYSEILFIDKAKRYYKKCIIHQDRLVGAILIGDKTDFKEFRELIEKKIELGERRDQLLHTGKKPEPVTGRLVCSCNNVGEGNLLDCIAGGCHDLKSLCSATGAGTGCGSCRGEVKRILQESLVA